MDKIDNNFYILNGNNIYITDLQNTIKHTLDYQKITGEKDMLSNGISIVDNNIFILLYKIYEFDELRYIFLNKRIIIKSNKDFTSYTTYMEDKSSDLIFYDLSYYKPTNSFLSFNRKILSVSRLDYDFGTFKELKLDEINQNTIFIDRKNDYHDYTINFSELYSISTKDDIFLSSNKSLYNTDFICTKILKGKLNFFSEKLLSSASGPKFFKSSL